MTLNTVAVVNWDGQIVKFMHNPYSSKTECLFVLLDKMCAIFSVNTQGFSSSKNCKPKMNHACTFLLSYYCSAHLLGTLLWLTERLAVKIGEQTQLLVKGKKKPTKKKERSKE